MNRDDINKVADWMMQRGYATGHGETMEDLLAELDWQIAENWNRAMINGIETEREAWRYADELEQERKRLHEVNAELLEAVKAALSDDQPYIERCKAALVKATGEQQ